MPKTKKSRIFVDASVFVAAVMSPTGGSFRIFQEADRFGMLLVVTPYVLAEVETVIGIKRPDLIKHFRSFLSVFPIRVLKNPGERHVNRYLHIIAQKDAPIIAGTVKARADALITLDRKDFINNPSVRDLKFEIMTPGDFIKKYFHER